MSFARWSLSLVAIVGIVALTIAGATMWLVLTNPVEAVNAGTAATRGDVSPLMQAIGSVLAEALRGLVKYL